MKRKKSIPLHLDIDGSFAINDLDQIPGLGKNLSSGSYELTTISRDNLSLHHASFEGAPQKHPYNDGILVLIMDPFTPNKKIYEFSIESIGFIEEIGTITSDKGKSALKIRVWVKKGQPAVLSEPFIVS